ncbi:MAG: single-stranded-DNA-specific exonuclease RecJ [Candidatus Omnitrophica bacterium]|nr:single-stranded-DNA-specific exonuclease RecJ [Candidatus Omnitrophota bacterium]
MPTVLTQKFWQVRNPDPRLQVLLSNALKVHPLIAQVLANRGIITPEEGHEFLFADMEKLHNPFLMKDMERAIGRIKEAGEKGEKVLIFGDYDVDGVTSSALLHKILTRLGINVSNHIPHRMSDGYGLNDTIGQVAKDAGINLIIAVDCGITASREVDILNELGIDVIIVDHHEPSPEGLPKAFAIIDPKRRDCSYPFKHLASVGLVAKMSQALFGKVPEEYLDLIALGTIADVVPLRGENRIFVKYGLPKMSETKNFGLSALIDAAKIRGKKFRPYYVGFILGPRINATGRMGSAHKSLDLLLAADNVTACALAQELETFNTERQRLQREVVEQAMQMVEQEINFKEHKIIVLCKEGWHKGVLGIVASRVAETYYRPTIIISIEDGVGTASARSIAGFHLNEALHHCAEILVTFGGHKLAAGLTIKEEHVEDFKKKINLFAKDILEIRDMVPIIHMDAEVTLSSLSLEVAQLIEGLEPYGEGNSSPVFCSRQLVVKSAPQIMGKDTIKFWVTDGQASISAVGFGMAKYVDLVRPGQQVDLAYELTIDDWNKSPTIQLKLKDIRESTN